MRVFVIGPGGVGKTTTGKILAKLLGYEFVDLDEQFMTRVGHIGDYIKDVGYEDYCYENSDLFLTLLEEYHDDVVIPLSSGFLVHNGLDVLVNEHRRLLKSCGITIRLLPSESLDECIEIIVKRQLQRGFGLEEKKEIEKVQRRFPVYKELGDIQIHSCEEPDSIAKDMYLALKNYSKFIL